MSPDVVHTDAGEHVARSRAHLEAAMRRVLENHLWDFSRDYPVTIEPAGRVDVWIPVAGPEPAGCAVLIVDAVVDDEDVLRLLTTAEALDRSVVRYQALVVVMEGRLSAPHAAQLRHAFGREPLTHVARSFEEDFAAAMKAMLHRFDHTAGAGTLSSVSDRIDRIDRQQARTQDVLAQVTNTLNDLRADLNAATRPARRDAPDGADVRHLERASTRIETPAPVRVLFEQVLRELEELGSTEAAIGPVFTAGPAAPDTLTALRQVRNAPDEPLRGLGCATLLRAVVVGFRDAVECWFDGVPPPGDIPLGDAERRGLQLICSRYDEAYEWLPMRELHGLRRLPRLGRLTESGSWSDRVGATQIRLERLGSDVREAALGLFGR